MGLLRRSGAARRTPTSNLLVRSEVPYAVWPWQRNVPPERVERSFAGLEGRRPSLGGGDGGSTGNRTLIPAMPCHGSALSLSYRPVWSPQEGGSISRSASDGERACGAGPRTMEGTYVARLRTEHLPVDREVRLVAPGGIEPPSRGYRPRAFPLSYGAIGGRDRIRTCTPGVHPVNSLSKRARCHSAHSSVDGGPWRNRTAIPCLQGRCSSLELTARELVAGPRVELGNLGL